MNLQEDPRTRCIDCGAKVLIGDLWGDGRCDPCHRLVTDDDD